MVVPFGKVHYCDLNRGGGEAGDSYLTFPVTFIQISIFDPLQVELGGQTILVSRSEPLINSGISPQNGQLFSSISISRCC